MVQAAELIGYDVVVGRNDSGVANGATGIVARVVEETGFPLVVVDGRPVAIPADHLTPVAKHRGRFPDAVVREMRRGGLAVPGEPAPNPERPDPAVSRPVADARRIASGRGDEPEWEPFDPRPSEATIGSEGINLSEAALAALAGAPHVEILTDRSRGLVLLRPCAEASPRTFKVGTPDRPQRIHCRPFCRGVDRPATKPGQATRYPAKPGHGGLVIEGVRFLRAG